MMILDQSGCGRAQGFRVQGFALEHVVTIHRVSGDLRWALAVEAARFLVEMSAAGQARLAAPVRHAARRIRRRVRLMTHLAAADTMVAAGGR